MPVDREKILETYLNELDARGEPPPPTATEPDRPPMPPARRVQIADT
jgi:hypothetical protein